MDDSITWPLCQNKIRRGLNNHTFGMVRVRQDGTAKPHQGWDFEAEVGAPFYAISDGTVRFVRNRGDYGLQLCLEFVLAGVTYYAFYAHLQKSFISDGEGLSVAVTKNTLLGKTGESGNAAGMALADQHLHFEVRTKLAPRLGLQDRVSPMVVFGKCPLQQAIAG